MPHPPIEDFTKARTVHDHGSEATSTSTATGSGRPLTRHPPIHPNGSGGKPNPHQGPTHPPPTSDAAARSNPSRHTRRPRSPPQQTYQAEASNRAGHWPDGAPQPPHPAVPSAPELGPQPPDAPQTTGGHRCD